MKSKKKYKKIPSSKFKPIKCTRLLSGINYYKKNCLFYKKIKYYILTFFSYFLTFLLYLVVMLFIIIENIIDDFKKFYNIVHNKKFL